jgi:putative two-component system response regulator
MTETLIRQAKILLVDDQEDGVALLQQMLHRAGYPNVIATTDSRQTLPLDREVAPDLLILDLHMPPPSGYEILDQLAVRPNKDTFFPILVLTADIMPIAKLKALSLGAKDFLTKPVEHVDLLLRVRNLLETRLVYSQLEQERRWRSAREAEGKVLGYEAEILERLRVTMECCDPRLSERAARVSQMAARLVDAAGLSAELAGQIERAAHVYDLGMLAVPAEIRNRWGVLSPEEKNIVKKHAGAAERILSHGGGLLAVAREIATTHHERWDGAGYPNGLKGEAIPLPARIVAVAEEFDILTHPSGDGQACTPEEALAEILRQGGFAFDPSIAEKLGRVLDAVNCKEEAMAS